MFSNNLLMAAGGATSPNVAAFSYVGATDNTSNLTTYTFTDHAIGDASSDRIVVVAVAAAGSAGQGVSSMTIGGVSATESVERVNGDAETTCALYYLAVSSGTTATIVVTLARGALECGIAVWAVTGSSPVPTDTGSNYWTNATNPSTSYDITIPALGICLSTACSKNGTASYTWTNVNENFDTLIDSSTTYTGASIAYDTLQTEITIGLAMASGASNKGSVVGLAFGPLEYIDVEYLIIGGGGGASSDYGGGGGAGGYVGGEATLIVTKGYSVTVGAGGAGGSGTSLGSNGSDSVFNSVTAYGGGRSGNESGGDQNGDDGGSGGGSGYNGTGGSATAGQGYAGGSSSAGAPNYVSAGGGGAGAAGGSPGAGASVAGAGGDGLNTHSGWASATSTGDGGYYAGGGGGGPGDGGSGNDGGAGGGGNYNGAGAANTGGGGGSGGGNETTGKSGGSGIVIIRYSGATQGSGGTIVESGGYTYHTFTSSGTFTA